ILFEGNDELKGVHGVEAKAAGAEKGEVVGDFCGLLLQHEVFNEQFFEFVFELVRVGLVHRLEMCQRRLEQEAGGHKSEVGAWRTLCGASSFRWNAFFRKIRGDSS